MSTTATTAAAADAPAAGAAAPAPNKISADIRRRAQGLTTKTKEELDADKLKADKDAADAVAAKTAEDKRIADEAAAKAAGAPAAPVVDKVKKVKAGPPLPDAPTTPGKSVEEQVRDALAKDGKTAAAAPTLSPEVEREVELARFAAKKHPDRYTGQAEKIVGFYQSRDQMLADKARELGGQQTGEFKDYLESDEFKEWVRVNRPAYQRGDVAKLQEDMIADRARAEARAEMAPEIKALERKTAELEHAPAIQARTNQALQIIITDTSAEKDPALEGFAKDPMKFGEEHPEEARLIATEAQEGVELIREVYRIDHNLVDFDPKRPTPQQVQINRFMVAQNAALREKHPTGFEVRPMIAGTTNGTILVDADTYERRNLRADPRYRTFTADEIAGMLAATKNAEVLAKLRQRREGVTKSIYAPKATVAAAAATGQAATATADDPPSPDAVVSRSPNGKGKTNESKMQTFKNRHLNGKG